MTSILRPATAADLKAFYGDKPRPTVRAIVGVVDGVPLGVAGISYERGQLMLFSDLKPEGRKYRKAIVKAARMVLEMAKGIPILALAEHPSSCRFLTRLGFTYIGSSPAGEVFRWVH